MKNLVYKICVGVVSFLQTLLFWMVVLSFTSSSTINASNKNAAVIGLTVILLIVNVLDKFLRKEDSWWCVLINVIFAPVRFITQIIGFVICSKKRTRMARGSYDSDDTKKTLVYYLTSLDLGKKDDVTKKDIIAAMERIAVASGDTIRFPSGAVVNIVTDFNLKGNELQFTVVRLCEKFELTDENEIAKLKPIVDQKLDHAVQSIRANVKKWIDSQDTALEFNLKIDWSQVK